MPRTRKETPQQARKSAIDSTLTPLYAVAGLTDAVAEEARTRLTARQQAAQQRAEERLAALKQRRQESADELAKFVTELPANLKALPKTTRERAAKLSEQASDYLNEGRSTYGELAGRGKRAVDGALRTGQTLSNTARKRAEDVAKDADPVFEGVQEAATRLRKSATGRTATDTVTPKRAATLRRTARTAASQDPAKKAATKKASATKATAKKAPTKKTATKATAKKAPATKATAKKTPAKKSTAKKAGASR